MGGLCELRLGGGFVTNLPVESEVVRHIRPNQNAAFVHRGRQVGDAGENIVIDLDRLGRVPRLLNGVSDDEGDGVADVAYGALGQNRMWRRGLGGAVTIFDQGGAGQRTDALGREVGCGVDAGDARQSRCCSDVEPGDGGRRMRATQHDSEQHAGQHDVVGVAAGAFEQPGVLHAADGLGEAEFGCSHERGSPEECGAV